MVVPIWSWDLDCHCWLQDVLQKSQSPNDLSAQCSVMNWKLTSRRLPVVASAVWRVWAHWSSLKGTPQHLTTCHSSLSSCVPQVPPPEQQDAMGAETALLTSIKALKNDSFAQRSFFLRLSFHDKLPLNLRNKKIVHCSWDNLTYNFLASQSFSISSTGICSIYQAHPVYHAWWSSWVHIRWAIVNVRYVWWVCYDTVTHKTESMFGTFGLFIE